jgi:hypothetical protein
MSPVPQVRALVLGANLGSRQNAVNACPGRSSA